MNGDCGKSGHALCILIGVFALCSGPAAQAADNSPKADQPDIFRGVVAPGSERPADAESQLREIESAKRLMKELGALHGGGTPAGGTKDGAVVPAFGARERTGKMPLGALGEAGPDEPKSEPIAGAREVAGVLSSAAKVVGVGSASAGTPGGRSTGASEPSADSEATPRRSAQADDPGQVERLLNGLIDEVLPWAIGFAILFAIGYVGISWMFARAERGPSRHEGSSRSSSRSSRHEGSRRRRSRSRDRHENRVA